MTTKTIPFADSLVEKLAQHHLLKHPFYQAWNEGQLKKEDLGTYARQYFHHVDAFPRYISATHSNCESIRARQFLLENLRDEEEGTQNHPELWMRFAEGVGESRESVQSEKEHLFPETRDLIQTFFDLSRSSYAEGLGALFAYEEQVPEVATTKIEGLKKFYGIDSPEAVEFFSVHQKADVYHAQTAAQLMNELSPEDQKLAAAASEKARKALWTFLDGVVRETKCC